jgi:hypothetical protein
MANDSLARGAKSIQVPSNSHIKQSVWDAAFRDIPEVYTKKQNEPKSPSRKNNHER